MRIDPRKARARPAAVDVRFDGKVKVMTLNVHKLVPASLPRKEGADSTESKKALRDTIAFIKRQNPDVLVLQELDNDVSGRQAAHGVPRQLEQLARGVDATGSGMASWTRMPGGNGYDNAVITRNGFRLDDVVSVPLSVKNRTGNTKPRSVGAADVVTPDGSRHLNVLFTHSTPGPEGAKSRDAQLRAIARLARDLKDGSASVFDLNQGKRVTLRTSRNAATIVGGDLNSTQRFADPRLERRTGLQNVIDRAPNRARAAAGSFTTEAGKPAGRIDHLYVSKDLTVRDAFVRSVTRNEVRDPRGVSDHRAVIAELRLRRR